MTTKSGWRIYQGGGEPHNGIDRLPPPPPWRTFDGPVPEGSSAPIPESSRRPGISQRARAYLPDDRTVEVVNAAIYLRRPLLVTGKPGTGKSTLAHSIALELKLGPVLYWPITSRSQLEAALYRYDAIGRLQEANLIRLGVEGAEPTVADIGRYVRLGPLGTALLPTHRPRVLLIDELDKSDIDLPNDLLNVLEEGEFEINELTRIASDRPVRVMTADPDQQAHISHGLVRCRAFPIVIITSNGEREFPPAFLRRCLQIRMQPPSVDVLAKIVAAQLGQQVAVEEEQMINDFFGRRDSVDLATDQLLNAIYLVTSGTRPAAEERDRIVSQVLQGLGSTAGS